ncbi:MAG: hypothetical protein HY833_03785 [Candidatus Aenigmarchaeota archaeon]|nr:hypothetical protein [Candidatus Aenigmarchaeota archaeon]
MQDRGGQNLGSVRDDEMYEGKIVFLWNLVKNFTIDLRISNRSFYSKISSILRESNELAGLKYGERGLEALPEFLRGYRSRKASAKTIYISAIYMSSLSRLLSKIFREAERVLGEERAREVFLKSFSALHADEKEIPDLTAYLPGGIIKEEDELSVTTYPTMLMDSLITYIVNDIIQGNAAGKNAAPSQPHAVGDATEEKVRNLYTETLGPIGSKWFERLDKIDEHSISSQVKQLREKSILSEKEAGEFMSKVLFLLEGARESG